MADFEYIRVRDKETKHRYDVLVTQFDEAAHEKVTTGPYKGKSDRPRPIQYFSPTEEAAETETPGEPSGETKKK